MWELLSSKNIFPLLFSMNSEENLSHIVMITFSEVTKNNKNRQKEHLDLIQT